MAITQHLPSSPSNSPRLPSPPPMAEDQTAPQSPITVTGQDLDQTGGSVSMDYDASRRIRPGTKAADMHEGPPFLELSDIESAFQLTEYLKSLHQEYTHPPSSSNTTPITRSTAQNLATPPSGVDRSLWLYELCRFLVQKVDTVIIALFADHPPCSASTCPEMRASEWQYLCAVHDPPKSCCAIDYCCHTLDWAANTLTSPKYFPSRLTLSGGNDGGPPIQHQVRQLTNIFRRVYRIFAHAWFQHHEVFWTVEAKSGLYVFFKIVCDAYSLIPEDNYTIPPEAEGLESSSDVHPAATTLPTPLSMLKKNGINSEAVQDKENVVSGSNMGVPTGATARRHKQTPSKSTMVVETVVEENEEDDASPHPEHPEMENMSGTAIKEETIQPNKYDPTLISGTENLTHRLDPDESQTLIPTSDKKEFGTDSEHVMHELTPVQTQIADSHNDDSVGTTARENLDAQGRANTAANTDTPNTVTYEADIEGSNH